MGELFKIRSVVIPEEGSAAASISVMKPGHKTPPHTGDRPWRLRLHLGLQVPDGSVLRVDNETTTWKDGKVIVFDDNYEHEVTIPDTAPFDRAVLILDLPHPGINASHWKFWQDMKYWQPEPIF